MQLILDGLTVIELNVYIGDCSNVPYTSGFADVNKTYIYIYKHAN